MLISDLPDPGDEMREFLQRRMSVRAECGGRKVCADSQPELLPRQPSLLGPHRQGMTVRDPFRELDVRTEERQLLGER